MTFKSVTVVGLGYIGLPTAAILASKGLQVFGSDINSSIVNKINEGKIHINEPYLEDLVDKVVKSGYLKASKKIHKSDAFIIAVPTPFCDSNSEIPKPDISFIKSAIKSIAKVLKKGDLIILESTSPVGTTEKIKKWLSGLRNDLIFPNHEDDLADIAIAYCPERVLPGKIIKEIVENDRIVGGISKNCAKKASELYKHFVSGECLETNCKTAEMVKLTENASRDVQIAFANELSILCDELDINVWDLIRLSNKHPRVNILNPGPGVGGHCIAVDPWFIVSDSPKNAKLIHAARKINDHKPEWVVSKIKKILKNFKKDSVVNDSPVIACLGLAFKADIDDLRESPAFEISKKIKELNIGKTLFVEPNIDSIHGYSLTSLDEAINLADILVLLVDHKEFKSLNKKQYKNKIVLDTKGLLDLD